MALDPVWRESITRMALRPYRSGKCGKRYTAVSVRPVQYRTVVTVRYGVPWPGLSQTQDKTRVLKASRRP